MMRRERVVLKPLCRDDVVARATMFGVDADWLTPDHMRGWSAWINDSLAGIGAVIQSGDGRIWGVCDLDMALKGRAALLHRLALHGIALADVMGRAMHVTRDPDERGSVQWLTRLGFTPTDETIMGREVWVNERR